VRDRGFGAMNRFVTIVFRHLYPLVGLNVLLIAIASYLIVNSPEEDWVANAELILPNNKTDLVADLGKLGSISGGEVAFTQQVNPLTILSSIILSNDTLDQVWQQDPEKKNFSTLGSFRNLFSVKPQEGTTIISLSASGATSELAKQRTENLINALQIRLNQLREEDASQRSQFMQEQLDVAEQNLQTTEQELAEFKESSGLVSSEEQTRETVAAVARLTTARAEVLAQFRANQERLGVISSRLELTPEQAVRSLRLGENKEYQFLRQELSELDAKLVETQALFTDEHPQVEYLLTQRNELLSQLGQNLVESAGDASGINRSVGSTTSDLIQQLVLAESNASALEQQANQLNEQINELNEVLQSFPGAQARLIELERQYDIAEGIYNGLVAKLQEGRLNAFGSYPSVQLLDQASIDAQPANNKPKKIALGAMLAALFGSVALVLLLESRNPLLSPTDVKATEIPVLGTIPYIKRFDDGISIEIESVLEFQRLASSVSMMQLNNRRLMISSATSGEGKTTVVMGLGIALTTLGFKVLLVDGDFHRMTLSKQLLMSSPLSDILTDIPIEVRPGLELLPASAQRNGHIMRFVAQGEFERSLERIQTTGQYDYVLIDSSPICSTSESVLLGTIAAHVLLVVRPGVSERHLVHSALNQLAKHAIRPIGMAVNGVTIKSEALPYSLADSP